MSGDDKKDDQECKNCGSSDGKKGACPECEAPACSCCDLRQGCWNCGFEMGDINP